MKRKSKKKRWIATILVIVCLAGGGWWFKARGGEDTIAVSVAVAENRTLTSLVTATGRIFPETEVKISSEVAGEIIELPVREGQRVQRGELLARIRPDTYEAQVQQREAAIQSARAQQLQRKAEMMQAELELQRLLQLQANDLVSQAEVDTARTRHEVQMALFEASQFEIKQRETLLVEAQEQLAKTTIYSPMSGTVSSLSSELGERVVGTGQFAGTEIMRIANLETMQIRIEVNENDIVNVQLGNPVRVTVDAIPGDILSGEVVEIASSAAGNVSLSSDQAIMFQVRIRLNEAEPRLRPGMTANADIETRTVQNALSIPIQSVTLRDRQQLPDHARLPEVVREGARNANGAAGGRPGGPRRPRGDNLARIIFVQQGDSVVMREVETGIASTSHIQVTRGLEPGETVVAGSYSAITRLLQDGSRVNVQTAPERGAWQGAQTAGGPGGATRSR